MNTRDEIKAIWGKISDLDWRLTKTRASIIPATDPEQFSFLDHFSDASIFWAWKTLGTSGIKTIVEAGSVLTFAAAVADCRWAVATNAALKASIGHPGLPCEVIAKINSVDFAVDALAHAGLFFGTPEGVSANSGIMFGRRNTGLYAYDMAGTSYNLTADLTLPIWLKMRISGFVLNGYTVSFQYSTDGIAWTTYQHVGVDFYWWGGTTPTTQNIGLVLRSSAVGCTATIPFEFFRMTRIFGPGGV